MCAMSSNFVDETLSVREFMKYGVKMSTFCVLNILKIKLFMGRFIHSFHFYPLNLIRLFNSQF